MMLYVVYLSYAVAALVAIIGALQIYIRCRQVKETNKVHHDAYMAHVFS
jgi:uncharacterized membrane protein